MHACMHACLLCLDLRRFTSLLPPIISLDWHSSGACILDLQLVQHGQPFFSSLFQREISATSRLIAIGIMVQTPTIKTLNFSMPQRSHCPNPSLSITVFL